MLCSLAELNKEKLEAIQSFEKRSGKILLAYSCKDLQVDSIQNDELAQIKELEKKVGLSLVAIKL